MRLLIEFDAPDLDDDAAPDTLRGIARMMERSHDDKGTIIVNSVPVEWSAKSVHPAIDIDRRQRNAAAALLMGFDLPADGMLASGSMIEAALIFPGMTTGDIPQMGNDGRRAALKFAQELIEQMLSEIDQKNDA